MFMKALLGLTGSRIVVSAFLIVAATVACSKDRSVKFEQVYAGANAPADEIGPQYFSDAATLNNSWVKTVLSEGSYKTLLSRINFERQVLLASPGGPRTSFSGDITITRVYQWVSGDSAIMNVSIQVGVLPDGCKNNLISVPFALAIIEKPPAFEPGRSFDVGNFSATCPQYDKK